MMGTPHPKNRDGVDEDDPARWARALARIFSSLVAATTGSAPHVVAGRGGRGARPAVPSHMLVKMVKTR